MTPLPPATPASARREEEEEEEEEAASPHPLRGVAAAGGLGWPPFFEG